MTHGRAAVTALALAAACNVAPHAEPKITSVTPNIGPAQGGTTITVAGTDLTDSTTSPIVLVGSAEGVVQSSTDSTLAFALPPGVPQTTVDITISDQHGFVTDPGAFTYNPLPVALSISPQGGPGSGGTTITIVGDGFSDFNAGPVTVTIGGAAATDVEAVSDQMVTAVTSPVPAGTPPFTALDVVVTDANGSAVLPGAYTTTKQGLMMISRNDETLSYFDPTTNDSVSLGVLSTRLHGCTVGSNGLVYAEGRDQAAGNQSALYTFDPLAGTATPIGPTNDATTGTSYALSSLAFVGSNLYGFIDGPCCSSDKRLVSLDLATGSATLIGGSAVTAETNRGMAIGTRDVDDVFYVENTSGTLDSLSITTSARQTGPQMSGGQGQRARALAAIGSTLYLLEEGNPGELYTVDTLHGTLTPVSSITNENIAMCTTPPSF